MLNQTIILEKIIPDPILKRKKFVPPERVVFSGFLYKIE
jgi:hypothetical protein